MARYGRWALLVSLGSIASGCQLELEGRACGGSEGDAPGACVEGWSCCADDVCRQDCSSTAGAELSSSGASGAGQQHPGATGGAATSSTSAVVAVGPYGADLALGEAHARVPAGALPLGTALELSLVELPEPLPRARVLTSQVYSLATRETTFAAPVTFEVPVDATSLDHMMVLELREEWEPLSGATFNAQEAAGEGAFEAVNGTVQWTTERGGVFAVVVVKFESSIELQLGSTAYSYACDEGRSTVAASPPNGGLGPVLDTSASSANHPECPWPEGNPRLWLQVLLRSFLPSAGPAVGTFELADAETILPLRVTFNGALAAEVPIGQSNPYQEYDSSVEIEAEPSSPAPSITYEGFFQSPAASGTVSVSRLVTVANAGRSLDVVEEERFASVYRIELSDVTMSADGRSAPAPVEPFPPAVTIPSAVLTYAF